jgi:hypothetical protein
MGKVAESALGVKKGGVAKGSGKAGQAVPEKASKKAAVASKGKGVDKEVEEEEEEDLDDIFASKPKGGGGEEVKKGKSDAEKDAKSETFFPPLPRPGMRVGLSLCRVGTPTLFT